MNKIDIAYEGAEVTVTVEGTEVRLHPAEAALVAALISDAAMRAAAVSEGRAVPAPAEEDEDAQ